METSHLKNSTNSGPSKSAPGKHPVFPQASSAVKMTSSLTVLPTGSASSRTLCKPAADMPRQMGLSVQALQPQLADQALTLTLANGAVLSGLNEANLGLVRLLDVLA